MTRLQLLLTSALGGLFLTVCAVGAAAQSSESSSPGLSLPAMPGAEAEPSMGAGRDTGGARRSDDLRGDGVLDSTIRAAHRAPCDKVISRYNTDPSRDSGRGVDLSAVARDLNTSVIWVERCLVAYGKPVKGSHLETAESVEDRLEALEEEEPEETSREEIEAGGTHPPRAEKQRVLKHPSRSMSDRGTGYERPE